VHVALPSLALLSPHRQLTISSLSRCCSLYFVSAVDTDPWETVQTVLAKAAATFSASEGKPVVLVVDQATYLLEDPIFTKELLGYAKVRVTCERTNLVASARPCWRLREHPRLRSCEAAPRQAPYFELTALRPYRNGRTATWCNWSSSPATAPSRSSRLVRARHVFMLCWNPRQRLERPSRASV
jgi:hypothetical protein